MRIVILRSASENVFFFLEEKAKIRNTSRRKFDFNEPVVVRCGLVDMVVVLVVQDIKQKVNLSFVFTWFHCRDQSADRFNTLYILGTSGSIVFSANGISFILSICILHTFLSMLFYPQFGMEQKKLRSQRRRIS